MITRHPRGAASTRTLGLFAAIGLAVLLAGGLGLTALLGDREPLDEDPQELDGPAPEVITADGGIAGSRGSLQITGDDPTEVAAEIEYERIEPLGGRRYLLSEPSAWIALDGGAWAYVRADEGRIVTQDPQAGEPESGSLTGGVVIDRYPPLAEGARPDPSDHTPDLTAEVDSLNFDLSVGEISTPDTLVVTGDGLRFEGRGVRALLSEVRQRIELLVVREQGRLVYTPTDRAEDIASSEPDPAPATASRGDDAPTAAGAAPAQRRASASAVQAQPEQAEISERYHLVLRENVVAVTGPRQINADRLDAWVTLYDRSLRPGALGLAPLPANRPTGANPLLLAFASAVAQQSDANEAETPPIDEPVELTWTGTLELRPFDDRTADRPTEIETEDVLVRLTADVTGTVRFADTDARLTGFAAQALYAGTSRTLTLGGPGPATVRLDLQDRGTLTCGRLTTSMDGAIAHVPGPGRLDAASDGPDDASGVSWTESADFVFQETQDGSLTLQTALFSGEVSAVRGLGARASRVSGGALRTEFSPRGEELALTRMVVLDNIDARDGRGGRLVAAERLDVVFERDAPQPEARSVTATGSVIATRGEDRLACEFLDATLEELEGARKVTAVLAEGGVELEAAGGISAGGERMASRPEQQVAEFSGGDAFVQHGPTRISGDGLVLDGLAGRVSVQGGGAFDHAPEAGATLAATWAESMDFNDTTGVLHAVGSVSGKAVSTTSSGVRAVDALTAERLTVRLASDGRSAAADPRDTLSAPRADDRPIELVLLETDDTDTPASVESRRYRAGTDDQLDRLTFLSSTLIETRPEKGTLTVPEPGRLLLADRAQAGGAPEGRGDALFEWDGSMTMNRDAGRVEMTRQVRMTHLRREDGLLTDLECERLTATLRDAATGEQSAAPFADLQSARASGAVYLRSGQRELVADELRYDAEAGQAIATPVADNMVRMFDGARGTVTTASKIEWDLLNDRVVASDTGPVTAPN
ncbi:MAG: hypothetical protein AAGG07_02155 [Planctomycetota bacterium]